MRKETQSSSSEGAGAVVVIADSRIASGAPPGPRPEIGRRNPRLCIAGEMAAVVTACAARQFASQRDRGPAGGVQLQPRVWWCHGEYRGVVPDLDSLHFFRPLLDPALFSSMMNRPMIHSPTVMHDYCGCCTQRMRTTFGLRHNNYYGHDHTITSNYTALHNSTGCTPSPSAMR